MIWSKIRTADSSCSPVNYLCLMTSLRVYNSRRIFLTHHCLFFTVSLSATLSALSFAFLGYFSVQARRSPVGGVFRSQSPSAHAIYFILFLFFFLSLLSHWLWLWQDTLDGLFRFWTQHDALKRIWDRVMFYKGTWTLKLWLNFSRTEKKPINLILSECLFASVRFCCCGEKN